MNIADHLSPLHACDEASRARSADLVRSVIFWDDIKKVSSATDHSCAS